MVDSSPGVSWDSMRHVSGAEILRREGVNLRDLVRERNGLGFWTERRANRDGFRFLGYFQGLGYQGRYAKGVDSGRNRCSVFAETKEPSGSESTPRPRPSGAVLNGGAGAPRQSSCARVRVWG